MPDLATALLVLAIVTALGVPTARSWADRIAVLQAREEALSLFAEARREAVGRGGAVVRFDAIAHEGSVLLDGEPSRIVDFRSRFGVAVDPGGAGVAELRYDSLGVGRVASRTILFRRGREERGLIVSSYGRVRRR